MTWSFNQGYCNYGNKVNQIKKIHVKDEIFIQSGLLQLR